MDVVHDRAAQDDLAARDWLTFWQMYFSSFKPGFGEARQESIFYGAHQVRRRLTPSLLQ